MLSIFVFIVFALFISADLSAQYKFFTGGTVGFGSTGNSESDFKSSNYTLLPYIGYSASDNLILGLAAGISGDRDGDDDNYNRGSSLTIQPFLRYREAANEATGIYGEVGVALDLGTQKTFVGGDEAGKSNTTGVQIYLGPGIDYAFADRWVINALWGALSYQTLKVKDVDGSTNQFGLNLNPASMRFSLNYMF